MSDIAEGLKLLERLFDGADKYKPDFFFERNSDSIPEDEEYRAKVECAIRSCRGTRRVLEISQRPRHDDLMRGAPMGELVTTIFEVPGRGVILYDTFTGFVAGYKASAKLLGFKEESPAYRGIRQRLSRVEREGDYIRKVSSS